MHGKLNHTLKKHILPQVNFRISFDYGNVAIMKTENGLVDLVGATINTCSKINELASANDMVIGGDLYEKIKHFHEFEFKNVGIFPIGFKQLCPVLTLQKTSNNVI